MNKVPASITDAHRDLGCARPLNSGVRPSTGCRSDSQRQGEAQLQNLIPDAATRRLMAGPAKVTSG